MTPTAFELSWLDDFDPTQLVKKLDDLLDGEYNCAIEKAKLKHLVTKEMMVLELSLEILTPGRDQGSRVQHSVFVKRDPESQGRFAELLAILGFDVKEWKKDNGRPFSEEVIKIPVVLEGMRFHAKKSTSTSNNKTYHNLFINKRDASDGKPSIIGPAELNVAQEDPLF